MRDSFEKIKNKRDILNTIKLKNREEYISTRLQKKLTELNTLNQYNISNIEISIYKPNTFEKILNQILLFKIIKKFLNIKKTDSQPNFSFNTNTIDKKSVKYKFNFSHLSSYLQKKKLINKDNDEKKNNMDKTITKTKKTILNINPKQNQLPIINSFFPLMKAVDLYDTLIVVAETGAGKTTQIPKYLFSMGYGRLGQIGITQPRRIAAINVATRVALEVNSSVGLLVGYVIRFEDCISNLTKIKFMTEGILLREIINEPLLLQYSVLVLDEAHERSIFSDILFSLLKDLNILRSDLKLIICSATINTNKFSKFFSYAPLFQIPGKIYSVEIYNSKESEIDYLDAVVRTILQIHIKSKQGDILVFLTGQEDIEIVENIISKRSKLIKTLMGQLETFPLYANLSYNLQNKIFLKLPINKRKVVLSTNIAETSLTISGITFVIDSGLCKLKYFDYLAKYETLIVSPIAKSSAWQRSGRAGRTAKGICFRLYTVDTYKFVLRKAIVPEIQRIEIDSVILILKCLGINDINNFEFLDKPPVESVFASLEHLYILGGLNEEGQLSKLGRYMCEFPLKPSLSKILIISNFHQCVEEILIICSILSLESRIFNYNHLNNVDQKQVLKKFTIIPKSDHLSYLNVFREWINNDFSINWTDRNSIDAKIMFKARFIFEQLLGLNQKLLNSQKIGINKTNPTMIIKCLLSGLFMNAAFFYSANCYRLLSSSTVVSVHPSSLLLNYNTKWVVFQNIVLTNKEFINVITEVKIEWLIETAPIFYNFKKHMKNY
mmetsp:Transcript_25238/g.35038  ORF Transcript_25238/g.35038 Transcript_25238/m.35038 type:complete len:780 (-) Transcript_25238:766-3105(-)